MNFESELSIHATETLHKQNPVLFDLNNVFCSNNQRIFHKAKIIVNHYLCLNETSSNTKGEIWVASDWVENLFSIPNQNKPYKGKALPLPARVQLLYCIGYLKISSRILRDKFNSCNWCNSWLIKKRTFSHAIGIPMG